jgi:hypothetical protein
MYVWQHAHARLARLAESVGMEELATVCDGVDSYYGAYKKQASMAVLQRDMQVAQADSLQQTPLAICSQASAVDWVCKACDVVVTIVTLPSPDGSPPH